MSEPRPAQVLANSAAGRARPLHRPRRVFVPPPNWPPPPPGWQPLPGWQPDPSWPPASPGWNFWQQSRRTWALDRAVAEQTAEGWSIWLGIVPVLALVAVLALEALVGVVTDWHLHGPVGYVAFAVISLLHFAAAIATIAILGRRVLRANRQRGIGGWRGAFGWGPWKLIDLAIGFGGAVAEFIARLLVAVALVAAVPALRGHTESNIDLHNRSTPALVLLLILAVCVAPPVEELIFRGALLRSLMKRTGRFWLSAVISSVIFAALHLYEVSSLASMVLLFASILVFGLGQCLLVRWTGRLGTSIVAHAVSNGGAALLTLAASR